MPAFAVVVLLLALVAVVALVVVRSRAEPVQRPRSKQRAKRENAEVSDDAPRMPTGDFPQRSTRRSE